MKKIIIMFVVGLLTQQVVRAQGTITYLSNMGQPSTGSSSVGSDSWLATDIVTGNNAGGYSLNSVQLGMTGASGNPSGFTVMIYSAFIGGRPTPGSSLDTLSGSANPSTAGIFTYTPVSSLTLSANTDYFIVLTAGTAVANGAYGWSLTSPNSFNGNESWRAGGVFYSSTGSSWSFNSGTPQFLLTATAVPEPSVLSLFTLSGLFLGWHLRKVKAVQ